METVPDAIEKRILLKAPLERVWRAVSDSAAFGTWFGAEFEGPFVAGTTVRGRITATQVDPDVAKMQAPYAGTPFQLFVEQVEPPRRLAFRWNPYEAEPGEDPAQLPTTLVELTLEPQPGGTLLTLRESGYSKLPPERRAKAFTNNEGGWTLQMQLVSKYLDRHG